MSEVPCRKRDDYLEWPEYFMAVAFLSAQRSKDPNSQVGACIVNAENKIVGIGYNGMPNGCSDDVLPWRRTAERKLDTKYPYVCHAELNAIMNKNSADVKGCTMYVALFPCNECAKLIIQAGIKEVIFISDKYHDSDETTAARLLFDMAGVAFRKFTPKCSKIVIDFDSINSRPSQKLHALTLASLNNELFLEETACLPSSPPRPRLLGHQGCGDRGGAGTSFLHRVGRVAAPPRANTVHGQGCSPTGE
ncbi:deoxycytidylate deaminase isoform X1 [Lynx rufus]|uniref:deoxycytidylate deaminase isoform X1 n=1 Tax=Lynx rufus TaxID=61384 RepID=UPI001F1266E5|nr:deoxycytidylate deaminase isoform X1 [Lynx rufus]